MTADAPAGGSGPPLPATTPPGSGRRHLAALRRRSFRRRGWPTGRTPARPALCRSRRHGCDLGHDRAVPSPVEPAAPRHHGALPARRSARTATAAATPPPSPTGWTGGRRPRSWSATPPAPRSTGAGWAASPPGKHTASWDGRRSAGRPAPDGDYTVQIATSNGDPAGAGQRLAAGRPPRPGADRRARLVPSGAAGQGRLPGQRRAGGPGRGGRCGRSGWRSAPGPAGSSAGQGRWARRRSDRGPGVGRPHRRRQPVPGQLPASGWWPRTWPATAAARAAHGHRVRSNGWSSGPAHHGDRPRLARGDLRGRLLAGLPPHQRPARRLGGVRELLDLHAPATRTPPATTRSGCRRRSGTAPCASRRTAAAATSGTATRRESSTTTACRT